MKIEHKGFKDFSKGTFENGGDNLFVDSNGVIRRIMDNDLNGDGIFDIVFPNSHGYIERGPTYIYTKKGDEWEKLQLPHDSCWFPMAVDVDGDGYLDLIIANAENGVSSALQSYIYWGGPDGLTGEFNSFDTMGAYDADVFDQNGSTLKSVIFTTAWYDHHNAGVPMNQKVFVQTSPRQFVDVSEEYKISGVATVSLLCEDLNNDGYPEIVLANYREQYNYDTDSFIYWGKDGGFDSENPTFLPTHYASQVLAADLNGDGYKELIFTGGSKFVIYWNDKGIFSADNCLTLDITGMTGQFYRGLLSTDIADIDGDGILEIIIGSEKSIEIRKANDIKNVWRSIPFDRASFVKAVDINNTGLKDLVVSYYCSEKSYDTESVVFWNSKDGYNLDDTTTFETHGAMGCTAADLDNDGIKEIIFCNTMRGPAQIDPEFPVFVYYGTEDFKYLEENKTDYPVKMASHSYVAADVDNDGYVELIVTTWDGLRIFKGTTEGPNPTNYYDLLHNTDGSHHVGGVLVADLNRDGWLDLIMTPWMYGNSEEELANSVFVYLGGPEGYSDERRISLPSYVGCSQTILLADINNDGYLDFLYGDKEGYIGVHYGSKNGFNKESFGKIHLKDHNGAMIMGLTAADIDNDGWLELIVTTAGHYTRLSSHLYVLRGGKDNFPEEMSIKFETGGTTGFPAIADMNGDGNLDILLPFYSTEESRELPARIFDGDGKGNFDWENPLVIDCLASIAFFPVDLTGNGYPDVFICCHRDDLGHTVNSKLMMNGPEGLDIENAQEMLGYGPHSFTAKNQGNSKDRSDEEHYLSPVFECNNPSKITWEGETPFKTALSFYIRFGNSSEGILSAPWSEKIVESGSCINAPEGSEYMQYRVTFHAPSLVNSPRLKSVTIE